MELLYWIAERFKYKIRPFPKGLSFAQFEEWQEREGFRGRVYLGVMLTLSCFVGVVIIVALLFTLTGGG
jgi:hypothetical protein